MAVHTFPILDELPPGYCVEEAPRGILAVHVDVALAFSQAGFGPETDGPLENSDLEGRGPLAELRIGEERFLVRRFRHGGLLRWATGSRFLDPERPFRELCLAHALERAGVATVPVVAARARFSYGPGYRLDVVTRRLEGTVDLGRLIDEARGAGAARRQLAGVLAACGRLVREMHRHGFRHADLTPRNLLVRRDEVGSDEPRIWVVDLDGSRFTDLDLEARRANLRRLARHLERMAAGGPPVLTRSELARFLIAYDDGDGRWKDDWRAILQARRSRRFWHEVGWWLERRLGRVETVPGALPRS